MTFVTCNMCSDIDGYVINVKFQVRISSENAPSVLFNIILFKNVILQDSNSNLIFTEIQLSIFKTNNNSNSIYNSLTIEHHTQKYRVWAVVT